MSIWRPSYIIRARIVYRRLEGYKQKQSEAERKGKEVGHSDTACELIPGKFMDAFNSSLSDSKPARPLASLTMRDCLGLTTLNAGEVLPRG